MTTKTLDIRRFVKNEAAKMAAPRKAMPVNICQKIGIAAFDSGKRRAQYTRKVIISSRGLTQLTSMCTLTDTRANPCRKVYDTECYEMTEHARSRTAAHAID